jgi:hypothetical protein
MKSHAVSKTFGMWLCCTIIFVVRQRRKERVASSRCSHEFADFSLEDIADTVACVLELPFLEELVIDSEESLDNASELISNGVSLLSHPFIKYVTDKGLTPKFDPLWVTWEAIGDRIYSANFLSDCISMRAMEVDWLHRFALLPHNNSGYSIILDALDDCDEDAACFWYRKLLSSGMDLRLERLEPCGGDPEFRWMTMNLKYPQLVQLLFLDKIVAGPDKTNITPIDALIRKLGYLPFCKSILAHFGDCEENRVCLDFA